MASITQLSTTTNLSGVTGTKINSSASSSNSSSSSSASDNATKLKNQFLSILLTQMQHQNPMDPMDTKEFTGQLTQFSSLEQQIDTNSKLESLVSSITKNSVSNAFNYIGQYVDLKTPSTALQDGQANWTYSIPENAKSVKISVTDSTGKEVYSSTMQNPAGGSSVAAGIYNLDLSKTDLSKTLDDGAVLKLNITATNDSNKAITADIHTTVQVESVQSDDEGTYLQAGGMLFEIGDIRKIVNAPTTTNTTTV